MVYIVFGFLILLGSVSMYVDGYSNNSLALVIVGVSPFIIRGLIAFVRIPDELKRKFWSRVLRFLIFNPVLWLFILCTDYVNHHDWLYIFSMLMLLATPGVQLIWFLRERLPDKFAKKPQRKEAEAEEKAPIYDPYYASSLAQAKIERLERELASYRSGYRVSQQAEIERLERELALYQSGRSINQKALYSELASTRAKLCELEAECAALRESFIRVVSSPVADEETEMEMRWLKEENARLQNSLTASENAVAVLNQQLDDLRKTTR